MSEIVEVTIANGQSLSSPVDLRSGYIVEIHMPAAWTAASLTFQVAETIDGTYRDVYADDTEYAKAAAADQCVKVSPDDLLGECYLKVRSGSSASAVNQGAERAIALKIRALT